MYPIIGKNVTDVFYQSLELIQNQGFLNKDFKELSPVLINVKNPSERCLVIPHRNNNIVQSIAETLWVIGGRNDMKYLTKYLPRAIEFSDDGETWRGAYGKRLNGWFDGINQIKSVVSMLRKKHYTARGVMMLYDPRVDISLEFKDVPCTNWIQLSIRNNRLNISVTMRSNDLIWGFSGINFFEWSILQEMLAYWLNVEVGDYYYFTGYLGLFKRHFGRSQKMLEEKIKRDIYDFPYIKKLKVDISEEKFDEEMKLFFEIEESCVLGKIRDVEDILNKINKIDSNFLKQCLRIMLCYILFKNDQIDEFFETFQSLTEDQYMVSSTYYFARHYKGNHYKDYLFDEVLKKYQIPLYKSLK